MKRIWKIAAVYCLLILLLLTGVHWGSRAVTTLSESRAPERKHCIVIDPGHGGEDGGAVSRSGLPESAYNLEISLRLNDLLKLLGYKTSMIRTADVSVYTAGNTLAQKKASDLKERVRMVHEAEHPLLLSIHQNHYPDDRYSGAQMFYAKTEGSSQLAEQLQSAFAVLNPENNRQAKKCTGVYLMEHIQCPGVLIECGFLSNAEEEANLRNPEYQKKLCAIIAATTSQYLSNT